MNRTYWNRMAARYEDEIFSVLENDRAALVALIEPVDSNFNIVTP